MKNQLYFLVSPPTRQSCPKETSPPRDTDAKTCQQTRCQHYEQQNDPPQTY